MIITLAVAKDYVGVTGTSEDTQITQLVNDAGAAMAAHCNRLLEAAAITEYLDGDGTAMLFLREPADSITSIHLDGTRAWGASTLISSGDYIHHTGRDGTGRSVEYLDNVWSLGQRNIKVVYDGGYAAMPDDIERACRVQVARMYSEWKRAAKGLDNLAGQTVAGWAQTWLAKAGLDQACVDLLVPYGNARL